MDENIDDTIDSLIDQLKNRNNSLKDAVKNQKDYPELAPEDVDSFILKHASRVIVDSSDAISDLKETLSQGATSNDIIALSELIKSFSTAVDILNKKKIADNKNKTQKDIKQMDIDAKNGEESDDNGLRLQLSREEIFELMLKKRENISDTVIDV